MSLIHMPLAQLCSFVLIKTKMHSQRNLAVLKHVREIEISGRIVSRIAAEDHKQINFPGTHIGDEILNRFCVIDQVRIDGFGVENGFADVAKPGVQFVRKSVHGRRLMITGNDNAGSTTRSQVFCNRL